MKRAVFLMLSVSLAVAGAAAPGAQRRGRAGAAGASDPGLKHEVKDAAKRGAVCNDGSPAVFYVQAGQDPDRRKWIVFFQGGGGCATDAACAARWQDQHNLMTAAGAPQRTAMAGLTSNVVADNPDFARFNHVLVHYCSSDAYAGDAERTVDGRTLQFRGHRIVDAIVLDLMDKSVVGSPTLKDATDVLIAGSSAGAFGVQNNLDRLAAKLSWATVKGIGDSGWIPPDIAPFDAATAMVRPDSVAAYDYVHGQPDASCVAANPAQPGKCMLGTFAFKYITTPLFIYVDQRDPLHLSTLGFTRSAPGAQAYLDAYERGVRESLKDVPAAFCPSINVHTSLENERYHTAIIDGHPLAETLATWYFGRPGPVKLIASGPAGRGR